MTVSPPDRQPPDGPAQHTGDPVERTGDDVLWGRLRRRRERVRAEIRRNRTASHRVPTWVLATVLGALLLGWVYLLVTS